MPVLSRFLVLSHLCHSWRWVAWPVMQAGTAQVLQGVAVQVTMEELVTTDREAAAEEEHVVED